LLQSYRESRSQCATAPRIEADFSARDSATAKIWKCTRWLHFGVYNFGRVHNTLGTTPAVAAGVEFERWSLEKVVGMTAEHIRRKEDAEFEKAFAEIAC
jgi:hypothetical protein